jgi:hypothetical protein
MGQQELALGLDYMSFHDCIYSLRILQSDKGMLKYIQEGPSKRHHTIRNLVWITHSSFEILQECEKRGMAPPLKQRTMYVFRHL